MKPINGQSPKESAEGKKKTGRPSKFSEEIANEICERIAQGEGLRKIAELEGMPDRRTVFRWLDSNQSFRHQYAQARERCSDFWAEEILQIADDGRNDTYVDERGKKKTDWDNVHRSRLRIDTRKWLMSKLHPKKYGDKFIDEPGTKEPTTLNIRITGKGERIQPEDPEDA